MPTAVLGILIISLAVLLAVAGVVLMERQMPVEVRKSRTTGLQQISAGLGAMFGVIVGFSAFLVLNKYHAAQQTVQSEAGDLEEIYRLAQPLPESKQEQIQGLAVSYTRVVVGEEWPLMREGRTSSRADALAEELRGSIQDGYKTTTGAEQQFFGEELAVMDDLDEDREARLIDVRIGLPAILWVALVVLGTTIIGFSFLVGMESRRLHLFSVGTLATGIALVLFTIFVLDRPYGTDFRVEPSRSSWCCMSWKGKTPNKLLANF
jgi:NADH:ubiquinone oxidoreductase subunit 6 (subunit J)